MKYQGKKVAVLGFGTEGRAAYGYLKKQGAQITIHDQNLDAELPEGAGSVLGDDYLKQLDDYDVIFRSPGVLPPEVKTTKPVTSVMNEFLAECSATVIGVTGSKGKGTTTALIYEILKAGGKTAWLGGNIGTPPLEFVDQVKQGDVVALEMSNLQLWDITRSPQVAVVLAIFPEHMDWHRGNMEEYVAAKANIVKFQTEDSLAVYNSANQYSSQIGEAVPGRKLPFIDAAGVDIKDGKFVIDGAAAASTADVQLVGEHNLANVAAAIGATWGIVKNAAAVSQAIKSFKGLPHRLELVGDVNGVKYYDDSIGTTPEAAMAAIKAFDQPKVLIMGGSDKGAKFDELAKAVKQSGVKQVILIGETADQIKDALTEAGFSESQIKSGLTDMQQIVTAAAQSTASGDVVLLAPACASFGLFKDYKDRGDQFKQSVKSL